MQAKNANFFYAIDINEKGRLRNLFWADARSRAAYQEFGDVVTFNTTYLTNKYEMPFAPFVGVNHHSQSILLGCGLISSEDTETFVWLFKSWLACMSGNAPGGIITDQDRAMRNATEIVFPNTRHRWCLWHILKKIPDKLKGYADYESISMTLLNTVYDSLSRDEFERHWDEMITKYKLHENDWLNVMYQQRHSWVPSYVKDCFWAGMSTTQRSESMNSFFDGHVNSKTTLKQFVEQYENALRSKVEKENYEDFKCFSYSLPGATHYNMEKQAQDIYTTSKFKEFRDELTDKYIMRRWRKDVKRCHTRVQISYGGWDARPESQRLDMMQKNFDDIKDSSYDSEDKCMIVMTWLNNLKEELSKHESKNSGACGGAEPVPSSSVNRNVSDADGISNPSQHILTPLVNKRKGRPPSKRKMSKVEEEVRKKQKREQKKKCGETGTNEELGAKGSRTRGRPPLKKNDSPEEQPQGVKNKKQNRRNKVSSNKNSDHEGEGLKDFPPSQNDVNPKRVRVPSRRLLETI
uniref:protein FAR1-RELATED SEQUENCE 5-like n=1 Tax=Fragaria vesca subsp. vesca TaxID=101020 RepID=UPI0005C8C138|nr:PREDICTED: protein FAR1-RELATED SEQUENCE 5-like [Fragaria vesca subsp. vesca]XP_011462342.1 PREDICTED: protein FAR1-RELATED SEQUENCE 5-like [Fragaria vesca subsp. vesca]